MKIDFRNHIYQFELKFEKFPTNMCEILHMASSSMTSQMTHTLAGLPVPVLVMTAAAPGAEQSCRHSSQGRGFCKGVRPSSSCCPRTRTAPPPTRKTAATVGDRKRRRK